MIGNPYSYAVDMNSILVEYNGQHYTMNDAVSNNMIDPVIYWYTTVANVASGTSSTGYQIATLANATLEPWVGYWIHVYASNLSLLFQPVAATGRSAKSVARRSGSATGWSTTLQARDLASAHCANLTVGVTTNAGEKVTRGVDIYTPPALQDGINLTSLKNQTAALMQDYRPPAQTENYSWQLTVKGPAGAKISVTWPDLTQLPKDADILLHDTLTGTQCYLRTMTSYTVALGANETSRTLQLTVTPRSLSALQIYNLQAIRMRANGAAVNITCQVTAAATTTVDIRMPTGRLIRQLSSVSPAGSVSLVWDGKDATGRLVSRGAYQCQVRAVTENGQSVSALILVSL